MNYHPHREHHRFVYPLRFPSKFRQASHRAAHNVRPPHKQALLHLCRRVTSPIFTDYSCFSMRLIGGSVLDILYGRVYCFLVRTDSISITTRYPLWVKFARSTSPFYLALAVWIRAVDCSPSSIDATVLLPSLDSLRQTRRPSMAVAGAIHLVWAERRS